MLCANCDLPIKYPVFENVLFTINRPLKILFFNFCFFPNFKWLLSKILWWIFCDVFDNETATLLIFFDICMDMHFILFSLIARNITTSLLMMHLKCAVVHCANLNSSSKNKLFWNCGFVNMLYRFFLFLIYVYFNETFVKKFMK